ncbi:MAG: hypothetical protein ACJ77A_09155 [Actinomycetota bacterium]
MARSGPRGAWVLVAGIMLGALVAPRVAQAVGSLVTIQSPGGGKKATVTNASQLEVAEAAPSQFRVFAAGASDAACHPLAAIPGTKGFVVRSVSIEVLTPSSTGFAIAEVFPNGSCSSTDLASDTTRSAGDREIAIEPGFAIAAGGHLSVKLGTTGAAVAFHVFGYLVPAADVPSTTQIST